MTVDTIIIISACVDRKNMHQRTGRERGDKVLAPEHRNYHRYTGLTNRNASAREAIKQTRKMTSPADYLDILHLSCSSSSSCCSWCHRQSSSRKRRARQAGCRVIRRRLQLSQRPPLSADGRIGRRRAPHVDVRTAAMTSTLTTATCERVGEPSVPLSGKLH